MPGRFKEEPQGLPQYIYYYTKDDKHHQIPLSTATGIPHPSPSHTQPNSLLTSIPQLVGPFEGGGEQRTKDFWQKSGKQIVNRGREP